MVVDVGKARCVEDQFKHTDATGIFLFPMCCAICFARSNDILNDETSSSIRKREQVGVYL